MLFGLIIEPGLTEENIQATKETVEREGHLLLH